MEDRITHWTFRDIFLCFRMALDPILLGIGYLGLLACGAAYGILYYLGTVTSDAGARGTASLLGGVVFVGIWVLTSGILARVVATQLLEARKPQVREIWTYFVRRVRVLLLIPACFAGVVLVTLGGMGLLELVGHLPIFGPILFGLSFTVIFLLGLVALIAFALHTLAGLLYPTILAVRSGGVLGTVREILSLARNKPATLLIYSLVILASGVVVSLAILSLVWVTLALVTASAHSLMGERFEAILAHLPSIFTPFVTVLGIAIEAPAADMATQLHYGIGGFLVGVSLLSIFAATAAYPAVMVTTAGTIAYFILTDDELPTQLPVEGSAETPSGAPRGGFDPAFDDSPGEFDDEFDDGFDDELDRGSARIDPAEVEDEPADEREIVDPPRRGRRTDDLDPDDVL